MPGPGEVAFILNNEEIFCPSFSYLRMVISDLKMGLWGVPEMRRVCGPYLLGKVGEKTGTFGQRNWQS
jgi:hypothetical protein